MRNVQKCLNGRRCTERAGAFSSVPRLPAWSFQRLICEGNLPPPLFPVLRDAPERTPQGARNSSYRSSWFRYMRTGPGLPPQISREKDGGLPPVTSEKAPALSFIKHRVAVHFTGPCKLFCRCLENYEVPSISLDQASANAPEALSCPASDGNSAQ
jgi:hypothetical protein